MRSVYSSGRWLRATWRKTSNWLRQGLTLTLAIRFTWVPSSSLSASRLHRGTFGLRSRIVAVLRLDLRARYSLGRSFSSRNASPSTKTTPAVCRACCRRRFSFSGLTSGFSPRALPAASRVQCIDRGRRHVGGPCCEDALVPPFMVNSLTRYFALVTVIAGRYAGTRRPVNGADPIPRMLPRRRPRPSLGRCGRAHSALAAGV